MKLKQRKHKLKIDPEKQCDRFADVSKEKLGQLKAEYKNETLKFNSKEVAEAIFNEHATAFKE